MNIKYDYIIINDINMIYFKIKRLSFFLPESKPPKSKFLEFLNKVPL